MLPLYTLAYPLLSQTDRKFIDSYRNEHDAAFRDVVAPHFTMLFGCDQIPACEYEAHVRSVAARSKPIPFVCRYEMVCKFARAHPRMGNRRTVRRGRNPRAAAPRLSFPVKAGDAT
jgi:hypothetical protein